MNSSKKKTRNIPRVRIAKQEKKNEISALGQALRTLGSAGGGLLGGMLGSGQTGSAVGHSLGASVSKWLGAGDYSVGANSIVRATRASPSIPMMHSQGQAVTVRHKEYLAQVVSSQAFTVSQHYTLNPGQSATFPWLSRIAGNYQEYSIKGAVFHYIPTSGNAISGTNNALGSVMIQSTYRSTDTPPASKVELLNEYWACESVPSEGFCHPIECDPKENPFNIQYVRTGAVPTGDSKLIYDLGTTYVATSGQQANGVVLGDIWITYEIELRKPILVSNTTALANTFSAVYGPVLTTSSPFTTLVTSSGELPVTAATNTVTIPIGESGRYYFNARLRSTAGLTNGEWKGALTGTGFQLASLYLEGDAGETVQTTSTVQLTNQYAGVIVKSDPNVVASVIFPNSAATAGSYQSCSLTIVKIPL